MPAPPVFGQSATQRVYTIKALTDIWTGDADGDGERLITTGLLGSIRWWFEVLVRGLGGSACDPSDSRNRCPQDSRKKPTDPGHHCVVCELFGCTGWARKFRFQVLDENGKVKQNHIQSREDQKDQAVQFVFTELRPMRDEEWVLLDLTLRLIADYGAIGGRTVFKPSDEPNRQGEFHHKDFGLIEIDQVDPPAPVKREQDLRNFLQLQRWRRVDHGDFAWASLENFWYVKGRYLKRENADESTYNAVVGRHQSKRCKKCNRVHRPGQRCPINNRHEPRYSDDNPRREIDAWLAGRQQESKKIFSFKEPEEARRTFGFVKPGLIDFNEMRRRLNQVWQNFHHSEFCYGNAILQSLFKMKG